MSFQKTNVIEWKNAGPDDILWVYPYEDLRWGTLVVVHEYETAIFLRDGKLYDALRPGRHKLSTQNVPLLTKAYSLVMGYGETPFKAKVIFVALKQFKGNFGLNTRIRLSQNTSWLTELRAFGNYWFRIMDPPLFLTQLVGANPQFTTIDVNNFIRTHFVEGLMQELAKYDALTIYSKLSEISSKVKSGVVQYVFKNLGLELIDLKFGGVQLPLLEKMEKEDATYGLPLMAAMQSGNEQQVLEVIRNIETAKALGRANVVPVGIPFYPMQAVPPQSIQGPQQATVQQTSVEKKSSESDKSVNYVEKLKQLKEMLDLGLITQEEYNDAKKEILNKMKNG